MVLAVLLMKLNKTFLLMSKNSFLQREKRSSKHIFRFFYYPVKNWHIFDFGSLHFYLELEVSAWPMLIVIITRVIFIIIITFVPAIFPSFNASSLFLNPYWFQCEANFTIWTFTCFEIKWSNKNNDQPWSVDGVSVDVEPSKCFLK